MDEEMVLEDTGRECVLSHLENWKVKLEANVFYVSQVVANLMHELNISCAIHMIPPP